ncbi:hypothetical protein SKAU_G00401360 [Synaphobranchus kaupii]|uniref:Uncharacterized protein n=1 Tax=Synaphobranchus kaupii TaxID=118154 RepID=A0A9Q1E939_SYNKA|nr:hypothetical protein SKAU_G00401360 [Synaphobranchus kaupii]
MRSAFGALRADTEAMPQASPPTPPPKEEGEGAGGSRDARWRVRASPRRQPQRRERSGALTIIREEEETRTLCAAPFVVCAFHPFGCTAWSRQRLLSPADREHASRSPQCTAIRTVSQAGESTMKMQYSRRD